MSGSYENIVAATPQDSTRTVENVRIILGSGFQPDYVREVANAYARQGREVELIGGNMHMASQYETGVTFCNLRGNDKKERSRVLELVKLVKYYARLLSHVASSPSGVVYDVSIGRPLLRCLLMYSAFFLLGKRVIYTAHNVLPHDRDTAFNRIIYFIIYRAMVDAIIVHGSAIKERIVREFGVDAERVHVVSHGTYHATSNPEITKESAREVLGIAKDACVGLVFGFQRPYKGTHTLLEALADAPLAKPMTVLIRGEATDPAYREKLEAIIAQCRDRLTVNAKFESVPDGDVETLFKACDIVLLPYLEGSQSGIKYMAYAYGRPVLVSNIGSLAEFVRPGTTGEIIEPDNTEDLVRALNYMITNYSYYDESRIRDIAHDEFSFDSAVDAVDRVYLQLRST
ncbi:MAG: glycosyltransferase family 4 protein [Candidatus Hydrogenedentes bacterium]|nr:glycosyltransferase family 4 protein [Candidatus Hydrogenedentota bacterium]